MASDDTTSQDSMVIGDELVEALGFEPIAEEAPMSDSEPEGDIEQPPADSSEVSGSEVSGEEPARDVDGEATDNEESSIEMATNETDTEIDTEIEGGSAGGGARGTDPRNGGFIDLTSQSVPAPPTEADLVALAPSVESVRVIDFEPVAFEDDGPGTTRVDPVVPEARLSIGAVSIPGATAPVGGERAVGGEREGTPLSRSLVPRRHRLRARKTRRVVRHVDPWSVLTFSVIFHLCFFAAMLLASVLVWNAAIAAGTIENIESFVRELGDYERFEIDSGQVFTAAVLIAGMLTLASTIMVVLLTVVFNLISDLVGGIRVTVIEEETLRLPAGGHGGTPQVVGGVENR